jgi:hypothetical protein
MKNFFSIALAASSALLSVYAAPVAYMEGLDIEARDECTGLMCARHLNDEHAIYLERRADPSATAKTAIDWIKKADNNAQVNAKPLAFYSGYTDVVNTKIKKTVQIKTLSKLGAFQTQVGAANIDDVVKLTGQSAASKKWTTNPDWMEVSRALAQSASGTVYVLLGKTVPADSVWNKAEKAALIANRSVTKIEVYELDDKGGFTKKANLKG